MNPQPLAFYVCFAPNGLLGSTLRPLFLSCGLGRGQGISQSGRQDLALLGQGRPPAGGGLP